MGRKWTPEQKAAARERALKSVAKDSHIEIASIQDVGKEDTASLKRQIADLTAKLAAATAQRSEEELALLASLQGINSLAGADAKEVATGKMVKVRRLARYKVTGYKEDGREILRPEFKSVELPTFFYKINMPPCGGSDMKINGMPLYHGATVELDIDTLRTVKDMVYRMWAHDREIHGSDENFYRKANKDVNPQNTISMRMTG
jgi:hypothetical protein